MSFGNLVTCEVLALALGVIGFLTECHLVGRYTGIIEGTNGRIAQSLGDRGGHP
jgi:hypothetical protein